RDRLPYIIRSFWYCLNRRSDWELSCFVESYVDITISNLGGHHRCHSIGRTDARCTARIQHSNAVVILILDFMTVAADTDDRPVRISPRLCRLSDGIKPIVAVEDDAFRTRNRPFDEVYHSV